MNIFQIKVTRKRPNQLCMDQAIMHAHENQLLDTRLSKKKIVVVLAPS